MKRFSTNLTLFLLLVLLVFGCEKEMIAPENNAQTLQGAGVDHIVRPSAQCGSSVFSTLGDGTTNYGSVEMLNGDNVFYMFLIMEPDQFLDDIKVFTGDINNAPLANDGSFLLERFPYQYGVPNGAVEYTFLLRQMEMQACNDIVVWARVSTRDMFGTVIESHEVWMMGNHFSNGFTMPYCMGTCLMGNQNTPSL